MQTEIQAAIESALRATTRQQIALLRNAVDQEYGQEHPAQRVACKLTIDALERFIFNTNGGRGVCTFMPTGTTVWRAATAAEQGRNCDSCEKRPDFVCISASKDPDLVGSRRCTECRQEMHEQQVAIFGEG